MTKNCKNMTRCNRHFLKDTLYFLIFLRPTDALLHERKNELFRFFGNFDLTYPA